MTVTENGYASMPTASGAPGPLRISAPDGNRTVFVEAPTGGSPTSYLWVRHDGPLPHSGLALGVELTAAGWWALAARAKEIGDDLARRSS